jgi:4-hydroxybenzoate polyprenyltransferase
MDGGIASDRRDLVATLVNREVFRLLRPHQWAKNLLVFLPLVAAHKLGNRTEIIRACLAFVAFCLASSAGYVLNDAIDLTADRAHARKSKRPFASGNVSRQWALFVIPVLLIAAAAVALLLPSGFRVMLAAYLALTGIYTVWLKRTTLFDVVALAGLFTIRLFGGAQATDIIISNWLLAFSMFLFLSIALVKRVAELSATDERAVLLNGRGYRPADVPLLGHMGLSSGYLSVLVLALYINSADVMQFYRYPERLWCVCGFLFLWVSKIWLLTARGEMHDDPVVFVLRDSMSYSLGALSAFVVWWAT